MELLKSFRNDEFGKALTSYASVIAIASVSLAFFLIMFRPDLRRVLQLVLNALN